MKATLSFVIGLYLLSTVVTHGQSKISYQVGLTSGVNAALIKNSAGLQNILGTYNVGASLE